MSTSSVPRIDRSICLAYSAKPRSMRKFGVSGRIRAPIMIITAGTQADDHSIFDPNVEARSCYSMYVDFIGSSDRSKHLLGLFSEATFDEEVWSVRKDQSSDHDHHCRDTS
ncbi:hypothetical protein F2Q70_00010193 [Brassica cretica]|uniref:Uncharacterized protein n=1 Tax=Brassica cretica TaxID=69181 RepID=A0A8S9LZ07_BRACR|nr:hypothetical protein F2Q70_00010193 [Brassica cretica]